MWYTHTYFFQDLLNNSCRNPGFEGSIKLPVINLKQSVKKNDEGTKKVYLISRHMLQP